MARVIGVAVVCAVVLSAWALEALGRVERPGPARRLVRLWDFEESLEHLEPVPRHWYRAHHVPGKRERPGFPPWNWGVFDRADSVSGEVSLRLPTEGGSTSLMLAGGVVPALPDAEYVVAAQARAEGLRHAAGRLSAWFLDADLEEIPGTRVESGLIRDDSWSAVRVELGGEREAAWLQVELSLLQPEQLADGPAVEGEVFRQDFSGGVLFDDLAIYQVPRLGVQTGTAGNVAVSDEPPTLTLMAQDLTGEELTAEARVLDIDGARVAERVFELDTAGRREAWTPDLPGHGWFRVVLDVRNRDGVVGRAFSDFVWAPRAAPMDSADRRGFGFDVAGWPEGGAGVVRRMVEVSQAGRVMLPAWTDEMTVSDVESRVGVLAELTGALVEDGVEVTLVLGELPEALAREARLDAERPLDVFMVEGTPWRKYLDRLLTAFGERVRRWQIGDRHGAEAFWHEDLAGALERVREELWRLVPRPLVTLAWDARHDFDERAGGLDSASVRVPWGVPAEALELLPEGWSSPPEGLTLVLETPPMERFGGREAVIALVKRVVLARRAGFERVAIDAPWSWSGGARKVAEPTALLAAWRTTTLALGGKRIVGELPVARGARALIAADAGGGTIVAWNEWAPREEAVIEAYLGEGPVLVRDVFGNVEPAEETGGVHRVALGRTPVFIEGVDAPLALFRARMRVEPSFIEARAERHYAELVLENPWGVAVSGTLRIAEPLDWQISPRVSSFNIPPDRAARIPIELSFGVGEESGLRGMTTEVRVTAARAYPTLRVPLEVEIGLETVELAPSYRFEPGPDGEPRHVVVTLLITNRSPEPLTLRAFVQAPGFKGLQAPISELEPGASAVRQFRIEDAAGALLGKDVRVGLREQRGTGRLNKRLPIR